MKDEEKKISMDVMVNTISDGEKILIETEVIIVSDGEVISINVDEK
mgnify:CR=1 FL=1